MDKFKILFDHSSDAHFILDETGITDCNDAMIRLLKCKSRDEVLSIHPATLSPEYQPDGQLSIEKSKETDRIAKEKGYHRFEWIHKKKDGELFPVEVTLNAVEIDGKSAMISVWHDLTEQKKIQAGLQTVSDRLAKAYEELHQRNEEIQKDLDLAASVQQSLLPTDFPEHEKIEASWVFKPSAKVGGDNLNIFFLDEDHVGIYVLDATGHGVAAALLSVSASHFLSPTAENSFVRRVSPGCPQAMNFACPVEVSTQLNQHFCKQRGIHAFTMFYGVLDLKDLKFNYVCAGHPGPVLISEKNPASFIQNAGFPIGMIEEAEFEASMIQLHRGDRVYLYSDGITEARNDRGEFFGLDQLRRAFVEKKMLSLDHSVQNALLKMQAWVGQGRVPHDDISILAFGIKN